MPQPDRVQRIAGFLKSGQCLAPQALWREFSTSPATIKRDIAYLRDEMNLPVVFDRLKWGYRLETEADAAQAEQPRLLISADEARALATARQLLAELTPGALLADQRDRLVARLSHLLSVGTRGAAHADRRIVAEPAAADATAPWFEDIANAMLRDHRLAIETGGGNGAAATHEVTPKRLVHRDGRWHLEAIDHADGAQRQWTLAAITDVHALDALAQSGNGVDGAALAAIAPASSSEPRSLA
ncbi:MAG: WYL domain-containing protein [Proteobacteria bacterium]|nr:WYL domain-containing protein [Pseudomonadota bacterium]